MPGSVLIIDADEDFAGRLKSTLETHGADVQVTGDGRAGLDIARINVPNAIVVCVELPRMSGYSICAKLKKDPSLKAVTLVITSAEATQETFEHHKKLKNRAEEYLRKPFDPVTLVEVLGKYIRLDAAEANGAGTPGALAMPPGEPEVIEDEGAFGDDRFHFDDVPDIDIEQSVVVEQPDMEQGAGLSEEAYEEDEAMTMIGVVPPSGADVFAKEVEQLKAELEAEREAHAQTVRDRDEAIANERAAVSQLQALSTASTSQVSASRDLLAIKKELHDRDKQLLELRDEVQKKERELLTQRDQEMEYEGRLVQLQEDLERNEGQRADLERQLADAEARHAETQQAKDEAAAQAEQAEADLRAQVESLQAELEEHKRTIATHEDEITSLRSTNQALNGEVTRMNNEVSATLAESATLREQLASAHSHSGQLESELQDTRSMAENTQNALDATKASLAETEEEAARAFERIRRDGETKTKVRQALDIALRLLTEPEENGVDDNATAEEARPTAEHI